MRITKLEFAAGAEKDAPRLEMIAGAVTVFVGPNNGGKSAALREIVSQFSRGYAPSNIFTGVHHSAISAEIVEKKLEVLTIKNATPTNKDHIVLGFRGEKQQTNIAYLRNILSSMNDGKYQDYAYSHFLRHLVLNLDGENRLGLVHGGGAQDLKEPPQSTIAALFLNDRLRKKVSDVVYEAFGQHLVIDPTSMNSFSYSFADKEPDPKIARSFDDDAVAYFSNAKPLSNASDGTKAFVGILTEVIAGNHEIILIDEPEAFLHPSLAYILGREIALNVKDGKQLFIATHSPYFLMGCISVGVTIDIVRLTYRSGLPTARLLPSEELRALMTDPLFKSIGVLGALFYDSAIVVEADADRAFYEEINSRLNLFGGFGMRHSAFLNAHGKHQIPNVARVLRNQGIPAAMVFDLDWIKEDGKVAVRYLAAAGIPVGLRRGFIETRRQVRIYLEATGDYKANGGVKRLTGAEAATADAFFNTMEDYGIFTIRHGELEHWLSDLAVNVRKDRWLTEIFAKMHSEVDEPGYVMPADGDVWNFLKRVKKWINSGSRQGLQFIDPVELKS